MENNKKMSYLELSSEEEFLQGVYRKIEILECRERENRLIALHQKKHFKNRLVFAGILLLLNIIYFLFLPDTIKFEPSLLYLWGSILIASGAIFEFYIDTGEVIK